MVSVTDSRGHEACDKLLLFTPISFLKAPLAPATRSLKSASGSKNIFSSYRRCHAVSASVVINVS